MAALEDPSDAGRVAAREGRRGWGSGAAAGEANGCCGCGGMRGRRQARLGPPEWNDVMTQCQCRHAAVACGLRARGVRSPCCAPPLPTERLPSLGLYPTRPSPLGHLQPVHGLHPADVLTLTCLSFLSPHPFHTTTSPPRSAACPRGLVLCAGRGYGHLTPLQTSPHVPAIQCPALVYTSLALCSPPRLPTA